MTLYPKTVGEVLMVSRLSVGVEETGVSVRQNAASCGWRWLAGCRSARLLITCIGMPSLGMPIPGLVSSVSFFLVQPCGALAVAGCIPELELRACCSFRYLQVLISRGGNASSFVWPAPR